MKRKVVVHYQRYNNDYKSFCGRVALFVGDLSRRNSSVHRNTVNCDHCKRQMKRDGIL